MDAPLPAPATKHVGALQHALPRSDVVLTLQQRTATADGKKDTGTTGTTLWLGGQVLAAYLASLPPPAAGTRALELGAGVGFLALSLAASGYNVLATDVEPVLSTVLAPNVDTGARQLPAGSGSASAALIDWVAVAEAVGAGLPPFGSLEPSAVEHITRADVVVTTDTLYAPYLIQPLWVTLAAICAPRDKPPAVYLCLERRDPRLVDAGLDAGRAAGLEIRRVAHGRVAKALDRAGWKWAADDWAGVEVWRAKWKGVAAGEA